MSIEHSAELDKIADALCKAQSEIKGALKDSVNPHFDSAYADLASVWEACRGPLTGHGLSVVQAPATNVPHIGVETFLMHTSGQWLRSIVWTTPRDLSPQSVGSAITYLRRYGLAATVGVAPEDDDGNAATGTGQQERPPRRQRAERQPEEAPQPSPTGATRIASVTSKTGTSKKTNKPWTRYDVAFEDGRTASTFDQQVAGLAQRIEAAKVLVTPVIEADGRNLRLVGLETDGEVPRSDEPPFEYAEPKPKPVSDAAATAERQALLLKVSKMADALKLTDEQKLTYWATYCGNAARTKVDPAALQDLIGFLDTKVREKGVTVAA